MHPLILALLLEAGEANMTQVTPVLLVKQVTPRLTEANDSCTVELVNQHSLRAIVWVIQRLPDRSAWHTTDRAKYPQIALKPGHTYTSTFGCAVSAPLAVEVAAVLYEDGSVGGDAALLDRMILALREKRTQEGFESSLAFFPQPDYRCAQARLFWILCKSSSISALAPTLLAPLSLTRGWRCSVSQNL